MNKHNKHCYCNINYSCIYIYIGEISCAEFVGQDYCKREQFCEQTVEENVASDARCRRICPFS
jgi:hypothetical protein